ncbi:uncharacterized protein VTP21DRAFT_286 [Calcarisporiella thermophila]|uniref:uncharacterized protein n=1 Tax=Calcarisporiella thermophila TaxID=911321 RepID=UPI0037432D6E
MADQDPIQNPSSEQNPYVRIISSDGFEFIIDREVAMRSATIKNMLSFDQFAESKKNEIHFPAIKAVILEVVCRYLYYNARYSNSTSEIPDFKIDPELSLELIMAADFLVC